MNVFFRALTMCMVGAVLFLGSCSKEDDPIPADLIAGTWKVATVDVTMKVGSQSLKEFLVSQGFSATDAEDFATQVTDEYENIHGNLEIKKGGTYATSNGGSTDTGTWELTSDGKTLTFDKGTKNAFVFTVTKLTSSNLNLVSDQSETDSGLTLSIHFEMTLTK